MNRRQKIIVSVTGIFLVLLLLVGLTYAYFLTNITGNNNTKSISVSTANLAVVYGGDDSSIIGDGETIIPGKTFAPKTFTVTNQGNATTDYVVVIEILEGTSTFESNDFTYTLTCESGCDGVNTATTFPINGGILVGNSIEEDEVQTYSFTLTYAETGKNQTNDMNKKLEARINIKDILSINPYSSNKNTLAYNIINNSKINKNGTILVNKPLTTPAKDYGEMLYTSYIDPTRFRSTSNYTSRWYLYGKEITMDSDGNFKIINPKVGQFSSIATDMKDGYIFHFEGYSSEEEAEDYIDYNSSTIYKVGSLTSASKLYYGHVIQKSDKNESILSVTSDDYGTSYYYRGQVEDNYVNFAGMCWRIVRIEGDGSVKLLLEDAYAECNDNETEVSPEVYTGYWSDGEIYDFGTDSNGRPDFINYTNSDGLQSSFKNFQITKLSSYLDRIKIDEWCYDNIITSTDSYCGDPNDDGKEECYTDVDYSAYTRIYTNEKPSLNCTGTKLTKFKDNTDMYVGTLTADEMAFAISNQSYLMNANLVDIPEYVSSLTPARFTGDSRDTYIFTFSYSGDLELEYSGMLSRPAITLMTGSIIAAGEGTIENPYIVE